jgi:uncharacterized repeat protein (TIGR01451 family)
MRKFTTDFSAGSITPKSAAVGSIGGYLSGLLVLFLCGAGPASAEINNDARAVGSYSGPSDTVSQTTELSVPVAPAAPSLRLSVSARMAEAGGSEEGVANAMLLLYDVTNNGNVSIGDVSPSRASPQFAGQPGEGELGAFQLVEGSQNLAPGQSARFEGEYQFALIDELRAVGLADGITVDAAASGVFGDREVEAAPGKAALGLVIPAAPALRLDKSALLNDEIEDDDLAAVGETITYTYRVTNSGNVALNDVTVNDVHEGTELTPDASWNETLIADGPLAETESGPRSDDSGTGIDGSWDLLQPGATVTFTYVHTVTQAEVDNQ